jgi:dephospho-CoA kinase
MAKNKLKIAVTGGIGTGKSEFCRLLEANGYKVLYADALAKEVLNENTKVKNKIIQAFGKETFRDDKPDIEFLSANVFNNPESVLKINSIIHPVVIKIQNERMNRILQKDNVVFLEAALIFEAGIEDDFDYIILIKSTDENRIKRVLSKGKLTADEINKRIANQIPDEEKKEAVDFVFENDGSLDELKQKVSIFLIILKSLLEKN